MAGNSRILTVKILTDASGASAGIRQAQATYGKFAAAVGSKSGSAGVEVGNSLVNGIDKALGTGLKIVGAGAGLLLGTALFKGFSRLNAIDQAQAKLKGLGHSAGEVATIMGNANAAVKGTAFGLADAATTAASVVASGIQPGKQLQDVLTTVADSATIAGASMTDMGSIFSKVAASNKLQGDVLAQLTDAGIPILQLLAKHYGTTADAARQMVTDGKVDFAAFAASMKEGMGGAALESGNTFQGAWENTLAAIGRIGANLLGPLFTGATDGLKGLPALLEPVEGIAKDVGAQLATMATWLQKNTALLRTLGIVAGTVIGILLTFRAVVAVMTAFRAVMAVVQAAQIGFAAASYGSAAAATYMTAATTAQRIALLAGAAAQKVVTAAQWAWNAAISANPIGIIIIAVIALVAAFVILWTKCEGFRNFFIGMWGAIVDAATAAWDWIVSAAKATFNFLAAAVRAYFAIYVAIFQAIIAASIAVWNGILAAGRAVFSALQTAIAAVGNFFKSIWQGLSSAASAVWNGILSSFRTVFGTLQSVAKSVFDVILAPIHAIEDAFNAVVNAVKSVINWLGRIKIPDVLGSIGNLFKANPQAATLSVPARPAAYGYSLGAPRVARVGASTATAGAGGLTININGGLDSADTIARRVRQVLDNRTRRTSGVRLPRKAS